MKLLKFSKGQYNQKLVKLNNILGQKVFSFSILPGESCSQSLICRTFVMETPKGLRLKRFGSVGCYAARICVRYPNVYRQCKYNYQLLKESLKKGIKDCERLLYNSIPRNADIIRWHVAGDFFSWRYFLALTRVVKRLPQIQIYCHSKNVGWVLKYKQRYGDLPNNLSVSLSYGGKQDHLIPLTGLKWSKIVQDEAEAKSLGLPIDRNDSFAGCAKRNFALVLH